MENDNYFYYFGYASNLKTSILEQRTGSKIENYIQGRLLDYGFRFNKKNPDGSARANIISSESEDVFGVVYEIDLKYKDLLLKTEPGYRLIEVTVETGQGNVMAFTFVSDADDEDIYPDKEYLNSILSGAKDHKLPQEYTDFIRSLAI
ncbi:gamma-glutamylcyclotransferase [Daejeonella oryzae]|uniref:gamma-glutamylcyclotransferase n=1 Tax=Daejeonella oryzae TaxID=1122943 RepID=UPI0003F6495D|nr:gamma-glutamylcyclotransferase [Daejeonella oryzae]